MSVSSFQLAGAATPKHDGSEGRIVPAAHSCQLLMSLSDFTENPPKSHQNTMAAKAGSCLQPTAASAYSDSLSAHQNAMACETASAWATFCGSH